MPRTTLDLDRSVLEELKLRARRDHKSMGQLASELLAASLKEQSTTRAREPFKWRTYSMGESLIDLNDRERLWEFFDREMMAAHERND